MIRIAVLALSASCVTIGCASQGDSQEEAARQHAEWLTGKNYQSVVQATQQVLQDAGLKVLSNPSTSSVTRLVSRTLTGRALTVIVEQVTSDLILVEVSVDHRYGEAVSRWIVNGIESAVANL